MRSPIKNCLSKSPKQEIVDFANKYFQRKLCGDYKRKGEDKNIVKVEKPAITPVETNPNANLRL